MNKLCEVFGRQDTAWDEYVKSLVEYRQGRFASAVDWAKKAIKRDNQYPTLDAQIYAVLAMSQHRLGHEVEAHASLIKGEEIAATRLRKRDSGDLGDDWHDWLKSHILLREAKRLLDAGAPRGAAAERTLECAVAAG